MGRSSVFSLEQIYRKQVVGTWSKIPEVFRYVNQTASTPTPGPAYGYVTGGLTPLSVTNTQRIDYGNDTATASPRGNLPLSQRLGGGAGNRSYGYTFSGIINGSNGTTVYRIDYASDSSTAATKGPVTAARRYTKSVGNADFGYTGGGYPAYFYSIIDRLDYANDTAAAVARGYDVVKSRGQSAEGNQSFGYFAMGYETPGTGGDGNRSTVRRLDYSNDNVATTPKGPLNAATVYGAASSNNDFGYFGGGYPGGGRSQVDRIDYSNDTATASPKGPLATARMTMAGTGNSSFGYFCGGEPGYISRVERIDYGNDTATASPKGNLAIQTRTAHSVSAQESGLPAPLLVIPATRTEAGVTPVPNFGYVIGGSWPIVSTVDRIDYANDTPTAAVRGSLEITRSAHQSTSNPTHAYAAAGYPSRTSVSRIEFSNDTATAVAKGPLTAHHNYFGATGNASFGYYAGSAPSVISTVDRIDYSSDTSTAVVKGPLSFAKGNSQGCGNQSFGYWAGGNGSSPAKVSSVDRVDYSSDTSTASPKGPLESSRSTMAASGTSDFGYYSGGYPYYTKTSRIDYANDTSTAVAKAPYPSTVTPYGFSNAAGTGNSTHGYAAGGNGYNSYVWRIDYANDTANGVQKGPLSQGRLRLSAGSPLENGLPTKSPGLVDKGADGYTNTTSGPAYGYFAGSYNNRSSVDRVDYNNDTATASPKGNLPSTASQGGGAGNRSYGYTFSGWAPGIATTVYRVDYANDTAAAATKGPVSLAGNYARSVGNADYGYTGGRGGGGVGPVDTSIIDRVDYANDTATATVVNPAGMVPGATIVAAVGNQSYGYFAGGNPGYSFVRRLDYSSDTTATSPKGPLSAARRYCGPGTGNADYGYVLGQNPSQGSSTDVERIDYSNDTATALTRGKRSINTGNAYPSSISGVSNPTYAYFGGGDPASTHVDRIEFSNDTPTASPKGNLATARKSPYSFSAQNSGLPLTTYIPRIRWVDSKPETPAGSGPTAGPAYGYSGGGGAASFGTRETGGTRVERIDFANDTATASPRGKLAHDHLECAAFGNANHGYVMGDSYSTTNRSWISRVTYASDTSTASPRGNMSVPRGGNSSTGNASYAWISGQYDWMPSSAGQYASTVDRIDFSNDNTTSSARGNLDRAIARAGATGTANYGWWAGGSTAWNQPDTTSVSRIDYANDSSTASPKGTLSDPVESNTATGNINYGYNIIGGGPGVNGSTIVRYDYASDTGASTPKGKLSTLRFDLAGATGSQSYGYFMGGKDPSASPSNLQYKTTIDRIDYSNDTATASPKGNLDVNAAGPNDAGYRGAGGFSGQSNAFGGVSAAFLAPVQPPFPFPVQLPDPRGPAYGYFSGGFNPANSPAHPSAVYYSNVDRIDFASDTSTASPKGKLDQARYFAAGAGSPSHGYIGASSLSSGYTSIVARVDYANDSATAVVKGSMSPGTDRYQSATSNTSYGWFAGGQPSGNNSKVQRIDFSNDDTTASPRGNLSLARQSLAGAGNADYGWHAGGYGWPAPDYIRSIVDRIDYLNDSVTATPKGNLSVKRRGLSGTGNASYGYYSGGYNVVPGGNNWVSSIDRIDYSNDSPTATPKGNLSQTRSRGTATGNTSYGYAVGGEGNNDNGLSTVDRIDFANDTATAATKGPLTYTARGYSGFSARANALPQ